MTNNFTASILSVTLTVLALLPFVAAGAAIAAVATKQRQVVFPSIAAAFGAALFFYGVRIAKGRQRETVLVLEEPQTRRGRRRERQAVQILHV